MRKTAVFLLLLQASALLALAVSCGGVVSEEDRVRAVIEDMAAAAEAKDARRIKDHISRDYSDPSGMGYQEMKGYLALQVMQAEHISVFIRKTEIVVSGDRAAATVKAVVARGEKKAVDEEDPDTHRSGFIFDLDFRNEDGDWMLTQAIHRQVPIMEAL